MLTTTGLQRAIAAIHADIAAIRDELNAADRHLGDGDTGMTIAQVATAWQAACPALPPDVGTALLALGRETGLATGSSLGAVMAIGLSAAGRCARGKEALSGVEVIALVASAAKAISERSGAAPGDKSVLDSLLRIEGALPAADDATDILQAAVAAAADALAAFRDRESRLGRARMYGTKSVGRDDPGMLAAVLLLRAAHQADGAAGS